MKKKIGRPKMQRSHRKDIIVPIRCNQALYKFIKDAAKENKQTVSEWIRMKVRQAIYNRSLMKQGLYPYTKDVMEEL